MKKASNPQLAFFLEKIMKKILLFGGSGFIGKYLSIDV